MACQFEFAKHYGYSGCVNGAGAGVRVLRRCASPEGFYSINDIDALIAAQRQQMFAVTGDDEIGLGGLLFWQANAMNSRGQVTQEALNNGTVLTNRSYDAVTGWVNSIQSGPSSTPTSVQNEAYLFDKMGNLIQRQNNALTLTESFCYDNVYRLTKSALSGDASCTTGNNLTVTYDNLGNITKRTDVASNAAWTYHASKKHAVLQAGSSSFTYTYDQNGNAITRNGFTLVWNKSNYPTSIAGSGETTTLSYDGNNQRWKQVYVKGSTTETTIYVGGLLEKVTTGSTVDWRHYISAGNQTIAVYSRQSTGTNTLRYLLEDHQGSIAKITSSTGTTYVSENFSAFGNRRNPATWSGAPTSGDLTNINAVSREGYTGQDALGSLGLNHMNGRVQDAITGRFLSADPYITEPGNTQNYNRYSYVYNNPMSYTDPSGFEADLSEVGITGHRGWAGNYTSDYQWMIWPINDSPMYLYPSIFSQIGTESNTVLDEVTVKAKRVNTQKKQSQKPPTWRQWLAKLVDWLNGDCGKTVNCLTFPLWGTPQSSAAITITAAEGAAGARGLSSLGGVFSSETNAVGGEVWTSVGNISQNDVATIVNSGMYSGDVNVISGVHGFLNGTTATDLSLFEADMARFGNLPGVNVYNFSELTPGQLNGLLNGPGTTIGGFCNSVVCLAPFR